MMFDFITNLRKRRAFKHDAFAERNLTVPRDCRLSVAFYGAYRCAVKFNIAHNCSFTSLIILSARSLKARFLSAFFLIISPSGFKMP